MSPRFVWAVGSYCEEFPDMPDDLPGITLFDRQEKKPVLTVTEDYMQLLCLETKVAPFTRLAEWCNALPNAALESEGIPATKHTSAPEFLDCVAGLVDEIDRCGVKVSPELERMARAAIARAEGGTS